MAALLHIVLSPFLLQSQGCTLDFSGRALSGMGRKCKSHAPAIAFSGNGMINYNHKPCANLFVSVILLDVSRTVPGITKNS
jgi:hypothetical protein